MIFRQQPKVQRPQPLGLAAGLRAGRHAVRHPGRALSARPGAEPERASRQAGPHQSRRLRAEGQPVRRPRTTPAGDLVARPPQHAGCRNAPANATALDVEHGARGGDEINIPDAGKNYGWPIITYGRDYSGLKIGEGTSKPGLEQPIYYWDPSIAPSGMAFYTGDRFPAWKGDLFVGALAESVVWCGSNSTERASRTRNGCWEIWASASATYARVLTACCGCSPTASEGRVLRLEPAT